MFNLNEKYFSISERCWRNHQNKFCLRRLKGRFSRHDASVNLSELMFYPLQTEPYLDSDMSEVPFHQEATWLMMRNTEKSLPSKYWAFVLTPVISCAYESKHICL